MSRPPNILLTGTPGTGKTTLCTLLSTHTGLHPICVGDWIKTKQLHGMYLPDLDTFELDEDKLCDELEPVLDKGGCIVDFHTVDFFPKRWFDVVIVLRTENDVLFPRLEARGYSQKKIEENVQAEIFQVVLDEARESYDEDIIVELQSNTIQDMEENVNTIAEIIKKIKK